MRAPAPGPFQDPSGLQSPRTLLERLSRARRNPVAVASLAAVVVALVGGAVTNVGPWYEGLAKPRLTPPNWLFAPAWTLIYALAVYAAVTGWRASATSRQRAWLISLFFVNAVLNVLWSALFFSLKRPDWALAEVATLWLSVAALIVFFSRVSRNAALALAPYLVWVGFAAWLNYGVVALNAPFR
jgi:tryptophan-rich sensory protein